MASTGDVSSVVDGVFYGFVVSTCLLGITIVNGWIYIHNSRDKWPIRIFVILLVILDISDTCCTILLLRYYLVVHFGDFRVLETFPMRVVAAECAISGTIMFLVDTFFASRLFLLKRSWWLPGIIVLCSMVLFSLGISILPFQGGVGMLSRFEGKSMERIMVFHVMGVFVDILVTIALSMILSPGGVGFKRTKMIFHQLVMYLVTRGILVTLLQIGHIVMYAVDPSNLLFWISLHLILNKLYVIMTLVILNSRPSHQDQTEDIFTRPLSFAQVNDSDEVTIEAQPNLEIGHKESQVKRLENV